jgi:hypothetical protein
MIANMQNHDGCREQSEKLHTGAIDHSTITIAIGDNTITVVPTGVNHCRAAQS